MVDRVGPALLREARRLGAGDLRITHGGKHPRLEGRIAGKPFSYVHPLSASDRRSEKNALAELRRMLRELAPSAAEVRPSPKSNGMKRRPRRRHKPEPAFGVMGPGMPVERRDAFYGPLRELRARLGSASTACGTPTDNSERAGVEADRPASEETPQRRKRIPLRTPWLGRRQRFQE